MNEAVDYKDLMERVCTALPTVNVWNGYDCVSEMKEASEQDGHLYGWRQSEWQGWYLEYLIEKNAQGISRSAESFTTGQGNSMRFDFMDDSSGLIFDTKTHAQGTNEVIANDKSAIEECITKHGQIAFLVVTCVFNFDDGEFADWQDRQKGKPIRHAPGATIHRRRKAAARPVSAALYVIDANVLPCRMKTMKQGRNSNGKPRPEKLSLVLNKLEPAYQVPLPIHASDRETSKEETSLTAYRGEIPTQETDGLLHIEQHDDAPVEQTEESKGIWRFLTAICSKVSYVWRKQ